MSTVASRFNKPEQEIPDVRVFPLQTEPEGVIPSLIERFQPGEVESMMALSGAEAVFIATDGLTITDRTRKSL